MKFAAITMVHCEAVFLKFWLEYYGNQFGLKNLYVFVHGENEVILDLARGANVIRLPRDKVDKNFDVSRTMMMNGLANFLLSSYDGVVVGDVDELVFVDPKREIELGEFIAEFKGKAGALKGFCLNVLDQEGAPDLSFEAGLFEHRFFARTDAMFCKPLVLLKPGRLSIGFHASDHIPYLPEDLFIAHLHDASMRVSHEISAQRKTTLENNRSLIPQKGHFEKWWGRGEEKTNWYVKRSFEMPEEELDIAVPRLSRQLRNNIVDSRFPGMQFMVFRKGRHRPLVRIKVPSRFASVL